MALPTTDTHVTYPRGETESTSRVLHVELLEDGRRAVLLDVTAFHPVDHAWPDQGPDQGELVGESGRWPVVDCVVGATDGTGLYVGDRSPVRKGTAGWAFVVVHLLEGGPTGPEEGDAVVARVDPAHRAAVSAGHTGCHLASLALNRTMAGRWKKEVLPDALGAPNFDALAIDTTVIGEFNSVDRYRLGKSLRRKGFGVEDLDPVALSASVNATLAGWTATGASIGIDVDGPGLTDRRRWICDLPEKRAEIPCGGTHLQSLAGITVTVRLELTESGGTPVLQMDTEVRAPATA
jgi:Ser-tRNA(Ala) deacylase AlaX